MCNNCCKFSTNIAKTFVNNFLISRLFGKICKVIDSNPQKKDTYLLENKSEFLVNTAFQGKTRWVSVNPQISSSFVGTFDTQTSNFFWKV